MRGAGPPCAPDTRAPVQHQPLPSYPTHPNFFLQWWGKCSGERVKRVCHWLPPPSRTLTFPCLLWFSALPVLGPAGSGQPSLACAGKVGH